MVQLITSFNEILFQNYGKRMVEEFSENSDGTASLTVMYEGVQIPDLCLKNVKFICFNHPGHYDFLKKFGHLKEARGLRVKILPNDQVSFSHDYKFDAVRFSFKIFSLLQAYEILKPSGYFAWIDADIRCLKKFGLNDLLNFFPENDQLMSYLGRDNFPPNGAYSECGFLGFNSNHPLLLEFLNRMAEIYQNGEIFTHKQWHDSWIWDQTRLEFESRAIKFKNISGAASKTEHPFINTALGIIFDHLKGPDRKLLGQSFNEDYKVRIR